MLKKLKYLKGNFGKMVDSFLWKFYKNFEKFLGDFDKISETRKKN